MSEIENPYTEANSDFVWQGPLTENGQYIYDNRAGVRTKKYANMVARIYEGNPLASLGHWHSMSYPIADPPVRTDGMGISNYELYNLSSEDVINKPLSDLQLSLASLVNQKSGYHVITLGGGEPAHHEFIEMEPTDSQKND